YGGPHRLAGRLPGTYGVNVVTDGAERLERHHYLVVLDEVADDHQDLSRHHAPPPEPIDPPACRIQTAEYQPQSPQSTLRHQIREPRRHEGHEGARVARHREAV